jgi:vancomycin aglycone glucosyltransferase
MKALISSIGTRGEVQPIVALALELRAAGHDAVLVVPPNFKSWVESFGLSCAPVGPDVQKYVAAQPPPGKARRPSKAQLRPYMAEIVREQFSVVAEAARDCDIVVTCGGIMCAGRSVAEARKIPYVYAAYCACTLPSADHPPPMIKPQWLPSFVNRALWLASKPMWNSVFREPLNEQRAALGLKPVRVVPKHVFTEQPWLAADPVLSPAGATRAYEIVQTGAWLLTNSAPLPDPLESFLAAGEPPVYFGFGSMRADPNAGAAMLAATRALGMRALLSRGWGNLEASDAGEDWLSIGDVDHAKLFPRVAAIVHHGGAGTTTAAARSGAPQVVLPRLYDQHYWAARVARLRIGVRGPASKHLDAATLGMALRAALRPEIVAAARAIAARIEPNGARLAAQRLLEYWRSGSPPVAE